MAKEDEKQGEVEELLDQLLDGSLRVLEGAQDRGQGSAGIYQAPTVEAAEQALEAFEERWQERCSSTTRRRSGG